MEKINTNEHVSLPVRLLRSEKFHLTLAIIGLVADTIGIATFIFAVGQSKSSDGNLSFPILVVLYTISATILLYSWFTIGWFMARRLIKICRKGHKTVALVEICCRSSVFAGLLTLPGISMWLCLVLSDPVGFMGIILIGPLFFSLMSFAYYFFMPMIYEDMMYLMEEQPFFNF